MGGACGSMSSDIYEVELAGKPASWRKQFEKLQLSSYEVGQLYQIFRKADRDHSGTIGLVELLTLMDVEYTRFTVRVFSVFDTDKSGKVDFREFVLSLWNFCTLSPATLDIFAFHLYDKDGSGMLSVDEIDGMIKDIYGKRAATDTHAKAITHELHKMTKKHDIDVHTFCQFVKIHHKFLFPAFEMQMKLQEGSLGTSFWTRNADRRVHLSNGKYVSVAKLMEMQT